MGWPDALADPVLDELLEPGTELGITLQFFEFHLIQLAEASHSLHANTSGKHFKRKNQDELIPVLHPLARTVDDRSCWKFFLLWGQLAFLIVGRSR